MYSFFICEILFLDDVTSESGFSRADGFDSDTSGRSTPSDSLDLPTANLSDSGSQGGRRKKAKPTAKRTCSFVDLTYWTKYVTSHFSSSLPLLLTP